MAFFGKQLSRWPDVAARYASLARVRVRDVEVDGFAVRLQYNPARSLSATAKVDTASIQARPCFLCKCNRPSAQIVYEGFSGFDTLVNPYPIFPHHFTIASKEHRHQDTADLTCMASMAMALPGFVVFYNGSCAGASAPDHLHFQAGDASFLPVCGLLEADPGAVMKVTSEFTVHSPEGLPAHALHFVSGGLSGEMSLWLDTIVPDDALTASPRRGMRNLLMWRGTDGLLHTLMYPRLKHRPDCYALPAGEGGLLVSPGAVDMAGVLITPREADFEAITRTDVRSIYSEVSYPYKESQRFTNLMLL